MPSQSITQEMIQAADYAVKAAKNTYGRLLDFGELGLENLEQILQTATQQTRLSDSQNQTRMSLQQTSGLWGSYLGETIRRSRGGEWIVDENSKRVLLVNGVVFSPIAFVSQKIANLTQDTAQQYYTSVGQRIATSPSTPELMPSRQIAPTPVQEPPQKAVTDKKGSLVERILQFVLIILLVCVVLFLGGNWLYKQAVSAPAEATRQARLTQEAAHLITLATQSSHQSATSTRTVVYRTQTPLNTITPAPTSTLAVRYSGSARSYIPDIPSYMPDYTLSNEHGWDYPIGDGYQMMFTSLYPSYHQTDDAYSVNYDITVVTNPQDTIQYFDYLCTEYTPSLIDAYNLDMVLVETDAVVSGVDDSRIYCANFLGPTNPGIMCYTIFRDGNLTAMIEIILHDLGNSGQRAIAQSQYFASLVVSKLR